MSTRRSFIRGLAAAAPFVSAAATIAGVAAAITPDAVFAAIEKHRTALAGLEEVLREDYEDQDGDVDSFGDVERETLDALGETVPTTKPGLLALVEYLEERIDQDDSLAHEILVPPIAEACRKLLTAGGAA